MTVVNALAGALTKITNLGKAMNAPIALGHLAPCAVTSDLNSHLAAIEAADSYDAALESEIADQAFALVKSAKGIGEFFENISGADNTKFCVLFARVMSAFGDDTSDAVYELKQFLLDCETIKDIAKPLAEAQLEKAMLDKRDTSDYYDYH